MPELPLVSPGEVIASDHINDIMLRTFQRYASIADRNTETPTPQAGELAYMDAEGQSFTRLAFFDGVDWVEVTSQGARVLAANGTVSAPGISFLADPDTGLWRSGPDDVSIVTGGTQKVRFAADGNMYGPTGGALLIRPAIGSVLNPTFSFLHSTDSGMYAPAAAQVAISAGGVQAFSATTLRAFLPAAYTDTTAAVANMHFAAGGRVMLSTSARKYKSNIQPAPELADLALEPVTFHHDGDDQDYIGFVADDMPDERAIIRDVDGEVENYDLRAVVAILTAKVNALTARVEALEA